ncbi:hypothetical protein Ancab_039710 [Ancistrocladus abbreviatus]
MEFLPLRMELVVVLAAFLLYKIYQIFSLSARRKSISALQVPGALPIIGHLHKFSHDSLIYRNLAAMADKYGPVFVVRLGIRRVLVVNNWEAVKECFSINDRAFASRPSTSVGKYLGYNSSNFVLAPYGPLWRDMRKLATVNLLSSRRLETVKHLRISEIHKFIKELHSLCSDPKGSNTNVAICKMFKHLAMNIMTRITAGKTYFGTSDNVNDEEAEKVQRVIVDFIHAIGLHVISDLIPIPFLEWLDPQGYIRLMKRVAKEFDLILESWMDEHQRRRLVYRPGQEQDYMDFILSAVEEGTIAAKYDRETVIKSSVQTVIVAGYDTVAVPLTWMVSLLLHNKHVLKYAQEEIDQKVGRDRWVEETDIESLVYLQAIVKETLRLYPPGPIGLPHEAIEDCHVNGYHVPKGTRLLVNIWKLHRDPRVWTSPEEFIPERFLTNQKNLDASGHHFEFIPFSSGRRTCPGMTLAIWHCKSYT